MAFFLSFSSSLVALPSIFVLLLFLYHFILTVSRSRHHSRQTKRPPAAPEAAGGWPLIGHLHVLRGPELPHVTLGNMAAKHGPIFSIRLGAVPAVVISNWEMARECFTASNDVAFSGRPRSIATELLCYNNTMFGFTDYGPYWRDKRKAVTVKLLSRQGLAKFKPVRESEVSASLKKMYDMWEQKQSKHNGGDEERRLVVEMNRWFRNLTLNIIGSIVLGKREEDMEKFLPQTNRWSDALKEFFQLLGMFTVGDAVPFLRRLDFGGYEKAMKKTAKDLDLVLQGCLEEHRNRKDSAEDDEDFMDIMISICRRGEYDVYGIDCNTLNKATCLALILGGSDSTATALTWTLALLLKNRYTLKKVQDEIDHHVGRERKVKESDLNTLVYLRAVVKETLRLFPPAMLAPIRVAMEDCTVGGYHVPAGTRLFFNLWKIHRDPCVWPDPMKFQPERFLSTHEDVDTSGRHFQLIPFGSGRRACVGMSFAHNVVELGLASLLQGFEVKSLSCDDPIADHKVIPLSVILTPRLSPNFYF